MVFAPEWLPLTVVAYWQAVVLTAERNWPYLTKNVWKVNFMFDWVRTSSSKSKGPASLLFFLLSTQENHYLSRSLGIDLAISSQPRKASTSFFVTSQGKHFVLCLHYLSRPLGIALAISSQPRKINTSFFACTIFLGHSESLPRFPRNLAR